MSLECNLSGADRAKGIDHSKPVSATWRDGEHFQWCVGHKAGVRILKGNRIESKLELKNEKEYTITENIIGKRLDGSSLYPELSFSVDQSGFGILASVDG